MRKCDCAKVLAALKLQNCDCGLEHKLARATPPLPAPNLVLDPACFHRNIRGPTWPLFVLKEVSIHSSRLKSFKALHLKILRNFPQEKIHFWDLYLNLYSRFNNRSDADPTLTCKTFRIQADPNLWHRLCHISIYRYKYKLVYSI
jgi:hypothetical protein